MIDHGEIIDRAKRAAQSAKRATRLAQRANDDLVTENAFGIHAPTATTRTTDDGSLTGEVFVNAVTFTPKTQPAIALDRRRRFRVIVGGTATVIRWRARTARDN
jgi:hypothetical protein